jgi:putative oxidoreductase
MKNLGMVGKIIFCLPFIGFGLGHLSNANAMAGMVPSYMPGGVLWIYLTGIAMLLAVVSILWGKMSKMASLLLGVMMILFVLMLHVPAMGSADPMQSQTAMAMMFKDLGLAGAALMLSANSKD